VLNPTLLLHVALPVAVQAHERLLDILLDVLGVGFAGILLLASGCKTATLGVKGNFGRDSR
jgi:hypothetical protein